MKYSIVLAALLAASLTAFASDPAALLRPGELMLRFGQDNGRLPAGQTDEEELLHVDGDNAGSCAITGANIWIPAARLTPTAHSCTLKAVLYWQPDDPTTYNALGPVRIYDQGTNTEPGSQLRSQPFIASGTGWQRVDLASPLFVPFNRDVWLGVYQQRPGLYNEPRMGKDAGPLVLERGDFFFWGPGWFQTWQMPGAEPPYFNWNIRGVVSPGLPPQHDVGATHILAPTGTVQHNAEVWPEVEVHNYGQYTETFDVRVQMDGPADLAYDEVQEVPGLASGETRTVTFAAPTPSWLADPAGNYTVTASTELAGDENPANDQAGPNAFSVVSHDVGATAILRPAGTVIENTVVCPKATVHNCGGAAETFDVRFIIEGPGSGGGVVFDHAEQVVGLGIGETRDFEFATHSWPATPQGGFHVRCTTELAGDEDRSNDMHEQDFTVGPPALHDVGATDILVPTGTVVRNTEVWPEVEVHNYGLFTETFDVRVTIDGPADHAYDEVQEVAELAPDETRPVTFALPTPSWIADPPGNYAVVARTELAGDMEPGNDEFGPGSFFVRFADVGAEAILVPGERYEVGERIAPQATWHNHGNVTADFQAWMIMGSPTDGRVYAEKTDVAGLAPGRDTTVRVFPEYQFTVPGDWSVRCSTYYYGDMDTDNDLIDDAFVVEASQPSWPSGWVEVESVPHEAGAKGVKDGAWLVAGEAGTDARKVLYVAKGNKTTDFYRYEPEDDTFYVLETIPSYEDGRRKPPSKGCAAVYGDGYVYMAKGNNTLGFWRYNVATNTWTSLPDVPLGKYNKKVKGGTDMVYAKKQHDTGYVYLLKGYKTEFYRYNTLAGRWDTLDEAPYGLAKQKYDKGSFLVYHKKGQTVSEIYCHQAKYYDRTVEDPHHYMFRYDVLAGQWADTLKGMPVYGWHGGRPDKKKKSKDGAGGAWLDENLYALKGGNTQQFFRYFPDGDTWQELDTLPGNGTTGKKKYVKAGGDLAAYGDEALFALKGNKTYELWRYVESSGLEFGGSASVRSGVQAGKLPGASLQFAVVPNPIASGFATLRIQGVKESRGRVVNVRVFDVAGRCVLIHQLVTGDCNLTTPLDLRKLSGGVYLVRLDAEGQTATQKLVVAR